LALTAGTSFAFPSIPAGHYDSCASPPSLDIDEASLGPDHPTVARDLNNLASLLHDTNRLAEAEPLMRRALAIFVGSLGLDHPSAITAQRNLTLLLSAMNRD
jgi:hypothetical protein